MEYIALAIGTLCLAGIIILRIRKRKKNADGDCCGSCSKCPYSKNCRNHSIK